MVKVVYSKAFLRHETGAHPECRERLLAVADFLQEQGISRFAQPLKIGEKHLFLVHTQRLIGQLKRLSKEKKTVGDNIFNSNTFGIALLAVGAALKAAKLCRQGFAFSLARPPGHHAGRGFFGGFCYLNNIAFAVRAMQRKHGFGRAMIVDFDLHHGNGTQDIFYDDQSVFYLSLHQSPEFTFPGTGFESENNAHIRNIPLEAGTSDSLYLKLFQKNFSECFELFQPDIVAVSAGFDTHAADAASIGTRLAVEKHQTFNAIGKEIRSKADAAGVPCFAVLEGGYNCAALPLNVFNFLKAFG